MADDTDKANELAEIQRQAAIYNAMRVTGNERLTGWCQWCKDERTNGAYCSPGCRNDASKRGRMG